MAGTPSTHALRGPLEAVDTAASPGYGLSSVDHETRLFWRLRADQLRNAWCARPDASRLRAMLVVLLTALLWSLLFGSLPMGSGS